MTNRNITPLKAIRQKCLDCMCQQHKEIKACPILNCSLWIFRLGLHPFTINNSKNPFLRKELFKGIENKRSDQVIKHIETVSKKTGII